MPAGQLRLLLPKLSLTKRQICFNGATHQRLENPFYCFPKDRRVILAGFIVTISFQDLHSVLFKCTGEGKQQKKKKGKQVFVVAVNPYRPLHAAKAKL